MPRMPFFVILLVAMLSSGCATAASSGVTGSLAAAPSGRIDFLSRDPYDFAALADGSAKEIAVRGKLVEPKGDWNGAAVILSHGSGGPSRHHDDYAEALSERGYAAFVIDHFSPRQVQNTAHEQVRVTEQMMVADVYAALALLATHPRIDAGRIGVVGWSKGGIVAVLSAVERIARMTAGQGPRLAFAAAFYPYCGFTFPEDRLASPLLMLMGEFDDWTPAAPCLALAEDLEARGQPVETVVFPGALHGFDGRSSRYSNPDWIAIRDTSPRCTLVVGPDGVTRTEDGAHDVSTLQNRMTFLQSCAVRGATIGGDPQARTRARDILFDFIRRATS